MNELMPFDVVLAHLEFVAFAEMLVWGSGGLVPTFVFDFCHFDGRVGWVVTLHQSLCMPLYFTALMTR